jgi:hypothetical protein
MSTLVPTRDYGSGPEFRKTFNCYGDFARFMREPGPRKCLMQQAVRGTHANSADHLLDLMEFGWKAGTARLANEVEFAVKHSPVGPAPVDYDVAGGIYDVQSGIMGLPERFRIEDDYGRTPGPVKLVWGNSLSGSFDDRDIERYGAAVVLLVQTLEARGIPVELSVEKRNHMYGAYQSYNVLVKAMHEPLDLVRLAFPMMHPQATRAVSWAAHQAISGKESQIPARPLDPKDGETFILPTFAEFGCSTDSAHAARKLAAWWGSLELSGRDQWAGMSQAEQDRAYEEATRRLFEAGRVGGSSVTDGHRIR